MSGAGPRILIRGGGDLATGVAYRLHHAGFAVVVAETEKPLAVRLRSKDCAGSAFPTKAEFRPRWRPARFR